jgi:hypothetical protein
MKVDSASVLEYTKDNGRKKAPISQASCPFLFFAKTDRGGGRVKYTIYLPSISEEMIRAAAEGVSARSASFDLATIRQRRGVRIGFFEPGDP